MKNIDMNVKLVLSSVDWAVPGPIAGTNKQTKKRGNKIELIFLVLLNVFINKTYDQCILYPCSKLVLVATERKSNTF